MKQIKFLVAVALISVIAISCKDVKKGDVKNAVKENVETAKEAVDNASETVKVIDSVASKAIDSVKAKVNDAVDATKEAAEGVKKEVKEGVDAVKN